MLDFLSRGLGFKHELVLKSTLVGYFSLWWLFACMFVLVDFIIHVLVWFVCLLISVPFRFNKLKVLGSKNWWYQIVYMNNLRIKIRNDQIYFLVQNHKKQRLNWGGGLNREASYLIGTPRIEPNIGMKNLIGKYWYLGIK